MGKVVIDKNTWYEDRGMYANQYEVKIHLLDSKGVQQDIITCFHTIPDKNTISVRLDQIKDRCNTTDIIIGNTIVSSEVDKYTPKQVYDMMVGKKVDAKTTWNDIFSGTLVKATITEGKI